MLSDPNHISPPDPFFEEPEPPERPSRSRLRSCFFGLISFAVIVGLMSTAGWGVVTIVRSRQAAQRIAETTNTVIPTIAAAPRVVATDAPDDEAAAAVEEEVGEEDEVELATAVFTPTPSVNAVPVEGQINRIAFLDSAGRIATINPDGTDLRIITENSQQYLFPTWSPTAAELAISGTDLSGASIYLFEDAESGYDPVELYFSNQNVPIYMYWSPNGRHLSFIASNPTSGLGLYIASPEEADESRLVTVGQPFYWNWTANEEQILIHTGEDRFGRLSLIDFDGEGEGENIASPGAFQSPGISPDGRYWAYAEEIPDSGNFLVVANTESGELQREELGGAAALSWSPTANQLAFMNGDVGDARFFGELQLLDAESGEIRQLSREPALAFFWSPDGRYLAYITFGSGAEDDIQAVNRQRLGKPAQQHQFQLDLFVVDVTTGEGLQLTSFTPSPLFVTQFLPFFDQYALSHRLWSPNSESLVLPLWVEDEPAIYVVPISGGQPRELAKGQAAFWSHR